MKNVTESVDLDLFTTSWVCAVVLIVSRKLLSKEFFVLPKPTLANQKLESVYNAFKEIYAYYRRRGFKIATVNADGEFEPLAALLTQKLPIST
jgi:hypothetical protein